MRVVPRTYSAVHRGQACFGENDNVLLLRVFWFLGVNQMGGAGRLDLKLRPRFSVLCRHERGCQ